MVPAKDEFPADLLARIAPEVPIKSPYPRGERLDGKFAAETVRRKVGDVASEFSELEGDFLERETGFEPATLSLGKRGGPKQVTPSLQLSSLASSGCIGRQ